MSRSTATDIDILYEDNHILAVNKRPGDIVQGDKTGDSPLSDVVKEWLRIKYSKPGNIFAGVVHRIDRPVSGVVVFAKTSKALSRLNELFKEKEVRKTYWACVPKQANLENATLVDFLVKDEAKNKSRVVSAKTVGAKRSEMHYTVLAHSDKYTLLEVNPVTGRHHQIRVQLSHAGFSIKGDLKYGAPRSNPDGSIHLHARSVHFIHPVSKLPIHIVAPTPNETIWNYFARLNP